MVPLSAYVMVRLCHNAVVPKTPREIPLAGIVIHRENSGALSTQLYEQVRRLILGGTLKSGAVLPATRNLAIDLQMSRNTVVSAYDQLTSEGYLESQVGSGTRVACCLPEQLLVPHSHILKANPGGSKLYFSSRGELLASRPSTRTLSGVAGRPFASGLPDLNSFPIRSWAKLMAKYSGTRFASLLSYGDPAGYKPLRHAISEYISTARAVRCDPEQVFIVNGSQQALDLCVRLLVDPGDEVAIEDPGYPGALLSMLGWGANVTSLKVDEEGADIRSLQSRAKPKLVFVTPSHQYPLGVTMSISRRLLLLDWAKRHRAWIIEDDYDSEFRYHGRPQPALQGLDANGNVLYVGSFSKTMFPSLRLGFLVLPPLLLEGFRRARAVVDGHSTQIEQAALAEFIASGQLSRHIRRMRELYAERQSTFVDAAKAQLDGLLSIIPPQGGMHLMGWLPQGANDVAMSHTAAAAGVSCRPLSLCRHKLRGRSGLLFGYAAFTPTQIRSAVERLAKAFENSSSPLAGAAR
jgi:GntR family transcriptional regulator/MocR family aminotransferase